MNDPLLYIGALPIDEIQASGYTVAENTPSIASEFTTASGLPKRIYRKNGVTTIKAVLDNLTDSSLASYLTALNNTSATIKFYSMRDKVYKTGDFYIDLEPVTVISAIDDIISDGYTLTLTQKGAITNVLP